MLNIIIAYFKLLFLPTLSKVTKYLEWTVWGGEGRQSENTAINMPSRAKQTYTNIPINGLITKITLNYSARQGIQELNTVLIVKSVKLQNTTNNMYTF